MSDASHTPCIYVLAGANGAGKSSIAGAMFRQRGVDYFDPDEATRKIRAANPGISHEHASSAAWFEGKRLLERAIAERLDFAFETTLGGETMTALLEAALGGGLDVRVWFVGLEGAELHISRVRSRVARGGLDIPEAKVRERYDRSRVNLIRMLPRLTELRVYDNSAEGDPATGRAPKPRRILHTVSGALRDVCRLADVPNWAKPIVAAAIKTRRPV